MLFLLYREAFLLNKLQEPLLEPCNQKKITAVIFQQFLRKGRKFNDSIIQKRMAQSALSGLDAYACNEYHNVRFIVHDIPELYASL